MSTATVVKSLCSSTIPVASQKNTTTTTTTTTTLATTTPSSPTPSVSGSSTASGTKGGGNVWERRDIAFLKTQEELEAECQDVVLGQDLNSGATGHPCIIMDLAPNGQHALITTVSSFRSGPHNGYLPPWQQTKHQGKDPDRFRSFAGTERYSAGRNLLRLEGGRQFRKNQTAWVYAGWVHLVPVGALRPFTDVKLRIEMQSWIDLYGHQCAMTSVNSNLFNDTRLTLGPFEPRCSPPSSPSPQMASAATSGSSTTTGGARTSTPKSQQASGSPTPPSSPAAPPETPRRQKQAPKQSKKGSPKTRKAKPTPSVNYGGYENVAGDFTYNSRQLYQQQETYQPAALYQQQQQYQLQLQLQLQSPAATTAWASAYSQQTQPVCGQYQYQQQAVPTPLSQRVQLEHTFSNRLISVIERPGGF